MSERGVFAVDRGIWADADFADEPFSEREAFLWLISEAAWRPMKVRIGHHQVDLARGQCAFSTRFMAEKWKWSEARVRRYLGRLISAEIVCTRTDKIATHITILKYDRFQRVSLPEAEVPTQTRRTSDAPATHLRRKEEDKEYKEGKEGNSLPSVERARKHPWPEGYRDQVWDRYGKKVEKPASMAALDRLFRSDSLDYTELISGIDRQAASVEPQFRPSLERFIKRQKWTDEYPIREQRNGSASNDLFGGGPAHGGRSRASQPPAATALARRYGRGDIGPGGWQNGTGPEDGRDHRSRHDDPEIADAEWEPAPRYSAAH